MATVSKEVARPEVIFRSMLPADVDAVAAIESEVYPFPWTAGIFRDCLRVGYDCHAIETARQVSGYGIMSTGAGEAHILNICVRSELRSRGIGRRMLEFLLDRAHAAGVRDAFLEVRPSNLAAIRLYQAVGFEQIGVRRGYYQAANGREDAAVFKLHLG